MRSAAVSDIARVANEVFGYDCLRPGQAEAIAAVASGRDTLAVLPTGAGKSAIYQIAGVLRPGATVVVSPLIALQRDQVEAIDARDVAGAAAWNSATPAGERRAALDGLEAGDLEFLFLAPESLVRDDVVERVREARPSLFVVDEAHCISSWGHDFRPDYLRLREVVESVGRPPVLALTATAAPPVRQEIVDRLGLSDPAVVVRGFDRPNIHLAVDLVHDEDAKLPAVVEVAREATPGIVYVATRRRAEEVAEALAADGLLAVPYHAGLPARSRETVQESFMSGHVGVVVATTAFGMGVDKGDVRFVVHHDIPDSLDSYYQEIGRAGRDGEPARAVLLFRNEDLGIRRFFASGATTSRRRLAAVMEAVGSGEGTASVAEVAAAADMSENRIRPLLARLQDAGAVELLPGNGVRVTGEASAGRDYLTAVERAEEAARSLEQSRLEMMRAYAETRKCRRVVLLSYFGEAFEGPCEACDNCDADRSGTGGGGTGRWAPDARVRHREWGDGVVVRSDAETVVVLFEAKGYRTLSVALVEGNGLLEPADQPDPPVIRRRTPGERLCR